MRRSDRQLSEAETYEILSRGEYGVLATAGADGVPYGVPINYALKDGAIFMHCAAADGLKLDNLRHESRASFTVVINTSVMPEKFSTLYESAIAFGTVEIVTDNEKKRDGAMALLEKYSADFHEKGMKYIENAIEKFYVLKFTIDSVTGKGRKK